MANDQPPKPKCYNCKFAGDKFKIAGKTHIHCTNPELYPPEQIKSGEISPWDSLREFGEKCEKHQYAEKWQTIPTSAA